jgi:hypothetical protein
MKKHAAAERSDASDLIGPIRLMIVTERDGGFATGAQKKGPRIARISNEKTRPHGHGGERSCAVVVGRPRYAGHI